MCYRSLSILFAVLVPLAAMAEERQAPAAAEPAGVERVPALLADADAAYAVRDEAGKLDAVKAKLDEAAALAPDDFEVLWRYARYYFWLSDDPKISSEQKSKLGKKSWDYAEQALAKNDTRVEGHYFCALGMGSYSLGIGVLKALTQGIEGKLKKCLSTAERIAPTYEKGGIQNTWGRFYFKLPWPKHDADKSEAHLHKAVQIEPRALRPRVFLAELLLDEGDAAEAKKLLLAVLGAEVGAYDVPEERRAQELARQLLPKVEQELK